MALLWAFFAVVLGCALVWSFTDLRAARPRWAAIALCFGAGAAGGIGLTSCIYFVCRLIAPGLLWLGIPIEAALLAIAAWNLARRRAVEPAMEPPRPKTPLPAALILSGALVCVLGISTSAIATSWDNNPQGGWDAWSIWNLRARFLAAPDSLFQRAWSPQLSGTHPEYPLLTSGFIARCWAYGGGATPQVVPMATAYLFFVALCAIGIGGVALTRSASLGILYGLIVASPSSLIHEVGAQYADVPLACYMLGAALLGLANRPVLAGIFAGLAAWTKDEGIVFLAAFVIAMAIFRRRDLPRAVIGLAAPLALVIFFKLVLARGIASLAARSIPGLGARLADFHRYLFIIGSAAGAVAAMGTLFYNPLIPAALAAALLRFERGRRPQILFCALLALAMLAAYFGAYAVTPDDIRWQVGTTVSRLLIQVWPLLLLILFVALRAPESMMMPAAPQRPARAQSGKSRRK